MMAAEAGVEVAQFNLAYLCEEDHVSRFSFEINILLPLPFLLPIEFDEGH